MLFKHITTVTQSVTQKPNKINRGQTIDADFRIKSSGNMNKMWGNFIT